MLKYESKLLLLQALNLFWYYFFIWRTAFQALRDITALSDERSDDEDDGKPDTEDDKHD